MTPEEIEEDRREIRIGRSNQAAVQFHLDRWLTALDEVERLQSDGAIFQMRRVNERAISAAEKATAGCGKAIDIAERLKAENELLRRASND